MLAWHFTNGNRLRNGRFLTKTGKWLVHTGPVLICDSGLHASVRLIDALRCAPGTTLHRVEVDDVVTEHDDKLVCRRRRILASADVRWLLVEFAFACALRARANANAYAAAYAAAADAYAADAYAAYAAANAAYAAADAAYAAANADAAADAYYTERRWQEDTLLLYAKAYGLLKG